MNKKLIKKLREGKVGIQLKKTDKEKDLRKVLTKVFPHDKTYHEYVYRYIENERVVSGRDTVWRCNIDVDIPVPLSKFLKPKLNKELVKRFQKGEISIENNRNSLKLLKRILKKACPTDGPPAGNGDYYLCNREGRWYGVSKQPSITSVPIKAFIGEAAFNEVNSQLREFESKEFKPKEFTVHGSEDDFQSIIKYTTTELLVDTLKKNISKITELAIENSLLKLENRTLNNIQNNDNSKSRKRTN